MRKKYFTEEDKKNARKIESKKYYDKIKKKPLTDTEKAILKKESKEKRVKYIKEYYIKNKEKILKYSKEYFKANQEIEQLKNNYRYNKRRLEDPVFKLSTNIKRNLRALLKKKGYTKKSRSFEILGCSFDEFKNHLESLWEPWMNWDNYGLYNGELNYGWDMDHIIPLASAITEDDVIKLNHYTNLQPLCGKINRDVKRDNVVTVTKNKHISKIVIK